jgi:dienelactone hydrolase
LEILRGQGQVDRDRIAAIGYCFGGATVMQMAYAGADLDGVVSFHGSLPPATDEQQGQIRSPILIAHGEADGFVPAERIEAFKAALDAAGADWQMVIYGGARHGFTNPGAGEYGMENLRYDPKADARSWALMQDFLSEVLAD